MNTIFKNPLTVWFSRYIRARCLELKHKSKNLKIGYLSEARNCQFGIFNTLYDQVSLRECTLGDYTYISSDTRIFNTKIGKFCSIGPNCKIGLGKHPSRDFVSTHPIFFSTARQAQISFADKNYFDEFERIEIGNDVWIGASVIVVDGISIGDGVMVGAGSVVTKNVPPYAIIGGTPAQLIRYRFDELDIERLLDRRWWDCDSTYLKENFRIFHHIRKYIDEMQK